MGRAPAKKKGRRVKGKIPALAEVFLQIYCQIDWNDDTLGPKKFTLHMLCGGTQFKQGVLKSKKRQVQTFLIVFTQVAFRFIKRYLYVCRNEYIHKTLSLLVSFISLKSHFDLYFFSLLFHSILWGKSLYFWAYLFCSILVQ